MTLQMKQPKTDFSIRLDSCISLTSLFAVNSLRSADIFRRRISEKRAFAKIVPLALKITRPGDRQVGHREPRGIGESVGNVTLSRGVGRAGLGAIHGDFASSTS